MSSAGMDRMLMCFERDAINWLRQVKIEFDATNKQFDENIRQTFIQTATDRYAIVSFFARKCDLEIYFVFAFAFASMNVD